MLPRPGPARQRLASLLHHADPSLAGDYGTLTHPLTHRRHPPPMIEIHPLLQDLVRRLEQLEEAVRLSKVLTARPGCGACDRCADDAGDREPGRVTDSQTAAAARHRSASAGES